ncbi:DUF2267 domain-containing protein [Aestuariibius sp. 2305UL40-4]|uniref:DUF2267 domain-containing protein n=1 Tax=Aestuariibius violaceus TaxID=3234132 RepID=UPI00345EE0AB
MSALGLKIIDESVQAANIWINEVNERVGWENKQRAYRLLRAVLQVLRDELSHDEAAHLSAQMPIFIRGVFFEGWHPAKTPIKERSRHGFIARVQAYFENDPMEDADYAIGAVLDTLDNHVSRGEMSDVRGALTRDIRKLFAD